MVRNFRLMLPSYKEQTTIAKVLQDVDDELDLLRKRLVKTKDVKQGMKQELLTGRIWLPVEEVA